MFKDYYEVVTAVENYMQVNSYLYTDRQMESIPEKIEEKFERIDEYFEDLADSATTLKALEHPDKALERLSSIPGKITKKYFSFFDSLNTDFNIDLSDIENIYITMAETEKQEYLKYNYSDDLEAYQQDLEDEAERKAYKKAAAALKKSVIAKIKKAVQVKQSEIVNSFDDTEKNMVKTIIDELIKEGRILKGRKDASKKGLIYLTFIK